MGKFNDLTGEIYSSWQVMYCYSKQPNRSTMWHCKCLLCGVEKNIASTSLTSGKSTKCRACATHLGKTKPFSNDPIKKVFIGMKQRCYNKNATSYKNYGAKGIIICDEWLNNPISFFEWAYNNGYAKGMSIERLDISQGYTPSNCTFIPLSEQSKNRSISHFITINNETKCLSDWCHIYNMNRNTVLVRHKKGMSWEEALTKPLRKSAK